MIFLILFLLPFIILYIISKLFLSNLYLFEWTARNFYLYLWLIVIILTCYKKYYIAASLVIGNLIGVFIGQFLGDYLLYLNIQKITQDMSNEKVAMLHLHHGVTIWIITILICLIIGIIITKIDEKNTISTKD
ncbi:hypothetical protein EDD65_104171 [Keratinibaculum paraultunense]|uniref:Uncharacterized protein n=1 Tax=Keratinibaculum paraultunense TaxID=1278232 RepID=A0A4R3KYM3_9FIRM|nr:hypothetical protein EDD65_104171 [Keratinibaculum paraultunense]